MWVVARTAEAWVAGAEGGREGGGEVAGERHGRQRAAVGGVEAEEAEARGGVAGAVVTEGKQVVQKEWRREGWAGSASMVETTAAKQGRHRKWRHDRVTMAGRPVSGSVGGTVRQSRQVVEGRGRRATAVRVRVGEGVVGAERSGGEGGGSSVSGPRR